MLPVKKISKTRSRTRQAHRALRPVNLSACPKCGKPRFPHAACNSCGYVSSKVMIRTGKKEE